MTPMTVATPVTVSGRTNGGEAQSSQSPVAKSGAPEAQHWHDSLTSAHTRHTDASSGELKKNTTGKSEPGSKDTPADGGVDKKARGVYRPHTSANMRHLVAAAAPINPKLETAARATLAFAVALPTPRQAQPNTKQAQSQEAGRAVLSSAAGGHAAAVPSARSVLPENANSLTRAAGAPSQPVAREVPSQSTVKNQGAAKGQSTAKGPFITATDKLAETSAEHRSMQPPVPAVSTEGGAQDARSAVPAMTLKSSADGQSNDLKAQTLPSTSADSSAMRLQSAPASPAADHLPPNASRTHQVSIHATPDGHALSVAAGQAITGAFPSTGTTHGSTQQQPQMPLPAPVRSESPQDARLVQISNAQWLMTNHGSSTSARVQIEPPALGKVHIQVQVRSNDTAQVNFTVANEHAAQALQSNLVQLANALQRNGIQLSHASVSTALDASGAGTGWSGNLGQGGRGGNGRPQTFARAGMTVPAESSGDKPQDVGVRAYA